MSRIEGIPTISVIMPTYNRGHMVAKAIESVLGQTFRDFEFIIVNDGSMDNTEEVIRSFKDERIRYVRLEKNTGTSALPRNTGIRMARGKYIAQEDDDTQWLPEKLEKQVKAFENAPPEVGVVYTGFLIFMDNGKTTYLPPPHITQREGNMYRQILRQEGFSINPPMLIRKECLEKVGLYDEKLPAFMDWDLWIRVAKYYQFKLIDEPLVSTYYSSSTSYYGRMAFIKGYLAVLNKHISEYMEIDKALLAKGYFERGLDLCLIKEPKEYTEGRRYLRKAFSITPLRLRYGLGVVVSSLRMAGLYNHALSGWDALFKNLRPLIKRAQPVLGWAYPFLNKVSEMFLLR